MTRSAFICILIHNDHLQKAAACTRLRLTNQLFCGGSAASFSLLEVKIHLVYAQERGASFRLTAGCIHRSFTIPIST